MPEVVVVGGGVIGAACAHELARRGLSVTLVERSELAAGASGRNHGLLLTPQDPALVPMFETSVALYTRAEGAAASPFRMDPAPIGFLIVATEDEAERGDGREEAEGIAGSGVGLARLDAAGLRELEPQLSERMVEGWLLEDGRRLDPAALTVSLALAGGADIQRNLTVRSLLAEGGRVRGVVTDDGPIEADEVVVAAGPWSPALLRPVGVDLPVVGARGWLLHLAPAERPIGRLVERAGWHVVGADARLARLAAGDFADRLPEPDVGTFLQPNPDGTLLAGGSRQRAVSAEPEDPSIPARLARGAAEVVPALAEAQVLGSWWGVRPMTPDGRPVVARPGDGLVVATGHGSQGVILAGGTAALVGALVADEEPPFDPAPFRLR